MTTQKLTFEPLTADILALLHAKGIPLLGVEASKPCWNAAARAFDVLAEQPQARLTTALAFTLRSAMRENALGFLPAVESPKGRRLAAWMLLELALREPEPLPETAREWVFAVQSAPGDLSPVYLSQTSLEFKRRRWQEQATPSQRQFGVFGALDLLDSE
ncbi:MAG: hypothetical protein KGO50_19530 [Myxococcales bacterium]|nr:hypothetical protein [Myxococcales bacterium]